MNQLIEDNRFEILNLALNRGIRNVRLFGSMADDTIHENSDVDLLVDLGPGETGFSLGGFLMDLQKLLGRKVDVVTESSLHPLLREKILKQAIRL